MSSEPEVQTCFEAKTGTWQYIVADPATKQAVIIDPVLDFDNATNQITTTTADGLLALVKQGGLTVVRILETHVHADHLTASAYLQRKVVEHGGEKPAICIGRRIKQVQARFGQRYQIAPAELEGAFDHEFDDREIFHIGQLQAKVLYLPGHTPDHIGYVIGSNVFTGDSIFNPDLGSARCDFPGGSADALFESISTLLALPPNFRLYTGHDYPPSTRQDRDGAPQPKPFTTVQEQRADNKHARDGTTKEAFVKFRSERDAGLAEPRLIHQALQFNIRAGRLPEAGPEGFSFLKMPLKVPEGFV